MNQTVEQFCASKGITVERYYEMKAEYADREKHIRQAEYNAQTRKVFNRATRRKMEAIARKAK